MKQALTALSLLALIGVAAWAPFALHEHLEKDANQREEARKAALNAQPVLRVGVMEHPTVYFLDTEGARSGLEHDLVHAFAVTLRSDVNWKLFQTHEEARAALARGELDIVATGSAPLAKPGQAITTQTKYHESAWILLNSTQKPTPKSLKELQSKRVMVSSRIYRHPRFKTIIDTHAELEFVSDPRNDDETLMAAVGDDEVPYAIVEEDTFNASRHFHFDTQRAFSVQPPLQRAWLFQESASVLRDDADRFLGRIVREGQLSRVLDRYFGFPSSRKQEEFEIFTRRVGTDLPRFRPWFQEAQDRYGIEWRLLAAVAYQESHWNADATSDTGVRGIMQFTEDTAKRFGVNRFDPHSSILGGARYINELKTNALAPRIAEPDKTWFALAAYNVGLGHLENARILTQQNRKNADSWPDVRRHLPLLAKPDVAARFKLGTCRCSMPVEYVEAVRAYYDVLLRLEAPHRPRLKVQEKNN